MKIAFQSLPIYHPVRAAEEAASQGGPEWKWEKGDGWISISKKQKKPPTYLTCPLPSLTPSLQRCPAPLVSI